MKHSNTPWRARLPEDCDVGCRIIYSEASEEIASTSGLADDQMDEGNAVLLASAPLMLDLLKWALELINKSGQVGDPTRHAIATGIITLFKDEEGFNFGKIAVDKGK